MKGWREYTGTRGKPWAWACCPASSGDPRASGAGSGGTEGRELGVARTRGYAQATDTGSDPAASGNAHRPPRSSAPQPRPAPPQPAQPHWLHPPHPAASHWLTAPPSAVHWLSVPPVIAMPLPALPARQPPAAIGCQAKLASLSHCSIGYFSCHSFWGKQWSRACLCRPRPFSCFLRGSARHRSRLCPAPMGHTERGALLRLGQNVWAEYGRKTEPEAVEEVTDKLRSN